MEDREETSAEYIFPGCLERLSRFELLLALLSLASISGAKTSEIKREWPGMLITCNEGVDIDCDQCCGRWMSTSGRVCTLTETVNGDFDSANSGREEVDTGF
jgi:hypothetical protein